jgi:hypothetical protein
VENYVAVGNDELGTEVKKGDWVVKGNLRGQVEYATDENGPSLGIIGYTTVADGTSYIVAIEGRLAFGWKKEEN